MCTGWVRRLGNLPLGYFGYAETMRRTLVFRCQEELRGNAESCESFGMQINSQFRATAKSYTFEVLLYRRAPPRD